MEKDVVSSAVQLASVEAQVKSNSLLTVSNWEEINASRKSIESLTLRVNSCYSEADHLTQDYKLTQQHISEIKKGTKRKWQEVFQFSVEVDSQLDSFLNQITDLESNVCDLSLQIQEIQTNQKKIRNGWIKSAAVGASAALVVVAGVILSPEWI